MTYQTQSPEAYIARACEEVLHKHGDTHLGNGYTRTIEEARGQYAMMMEVIRETEGPIHVLDFGCGLAHMLDYIKSEPRLAHVQYSGLDLSEDYIAAARKRHPEADLRQMDVLADDTKLPDYDYVVMNGVFNFRGKIPYEEMLAYWRRLLPIAFRHSRKGIAFNAMSKYVDWERDDLFHLPFDEMASFVRPNLSRHFVIRHDYPAYEYTTYVYREVWSPQ